jgi:hypothetical protein
MSRLSLTRAFDQYGATLTNPRWACSALANGPAGEELVVSLWQQMFQPCEDGRQHYVDEFRRWVGNVRGRNLLRAHLQTAMASRLPIRLVMACPTGPQAREAIDADKPAHLWPKTFVVQRNWVGEVVELTDEGFVLDFRIV